MMKERAFNFLSVTPHYDLVQQPRQQPDSIWHCSSVSRPARKAQKAHVVSSLAPVSKLSFRLYTNCLRVYNGYQQEKSMLKSRTLSRIQPPSKRHRNGWDPSNILDKSELCLHNPSTTHSLLQPNLHCKPDFEIVSREAWTKEAKTEVNSPESRICREASKEVFSD